MLLLNAEDEITKCCGCYTTKVQFPSLTRFLPNSLKKKSLMFLLTIIVITKLNKLLTKNREEFLKIFTGTTCILYNTLTYCRVI